MKNKTKITLALASGFGVALVAAGAVLLAIFPFRNASASTLGASFAPVNETTTQVLDGFKDVNMTEGSDTELAGEYVFRVAPNESERAAEPRLNELKSPFEMLLDKINARLGHGPEFAMLQGINLTTTINSGGGDALGLYVPNTNEIFINTHLLLKEMAQLRFVEVTGYKDGDDKKKITSYRIIRPTSQDLYTTYATYFNVLAEKAFQVLYHEYGHHLANVYLNTDNRRDDNLGGEFLPVSVVRKAHDTGLVVTKSEKWDSKFYQTFVDTLGYSDAFTNPANNPNSNTTYFNTSYVRRNFNGVYQYANKTWFDTDEIYKTSGNRTVLPLSNLYSLKELFDKANLNLPVDITESETPNNALYAELTANSQIGYSHFSTRGGYGANPVTPYGLSYLYSIEELVTRKLMQATMPIHTTSDDVPGSRYGYRNDGGISVFGSNSIYASDFLDDTLKSVDSSSENARPFYHDFLFADKVYASGIEPIVENSNDHAQAIYDAMAERMGYLSGDDISHIWWKNTNKVQASGNSLIVSPPGATDEIKFGGYISLDDLKTTEEQLKNSARFYLTYIGDNNQRVQIPVTISKFNYFAKQTLLAKTGTDTAETKDKYYYVLDEYVPISGPRSILNKTLYLAPGAVGAQNSALDLNNAYRLKTINNKASTDVRVWTDSRNPNFTTSRTVFPEINNGNAVIAKIGL